MSVSERARMHTAEHVLNQTMVRLFDCGRCFSAHLNPKKSKCDYRFERPLSDEEAREVETRVNEALGLGLDVTGEMMPVDEARELFDLSRLPDPDVSEVRVVRVGDYDACPCIGEHAANTAEVGGFGLISHSWEDGVLRLRFRLTQPE